MNIQAQQFWKKCSSCKKEIAFGSKYFVCSVSTCKHPRKGFQFCSVPCWDAHLGFANHRESWAVEETAPAKTANTGTSSDTIRMPKRTVVADRNLPVEKEPAVAGDYDSQAAQIATDTLIVVSKVKKLITDQSGFNTSQCCIDALTKKVIVECLKGIDNARRAERKTVMGRDISTRK